MKLLVFLTLVTLVAGEATESLDTPVVEVEYQHIKVEPVEPSNVQVDHHNKVELVDASVVEVDYHNKEELIEPSVVEIDYHNKIGIPAAARIKAAEEAADFDGARIVGGNPASLGQYPYMGGLVITLTNGASSVCGSSLLSNTRGVTAAHCWRTLNSQARQFVVVLGSVRLYSGGTRVPTSDVELHISYNMISLVNDIAIIRLHWVAFNNYIRPVGLATGNNQYVGTWAWAAGFGHTRDGQPITINQYLSHVSMQIITNHVCAATYGTNTVTHSTICAATTGGRGTCGGDSGGPLVAYNQWYGWYLIGVTSFGHIHGCHLGHPVGFARITSFFDWIRVRL